MNELDEILSGDGNAVPENQQEQSGQPRDDHGRFAAAQEQQPAVVDQPQITDQQQQPGQQEPKPNGVPVQAIQDEREKRQAAQAEAETLRRELAELRGMVMAQRQPASQPQQQEQQPASLWDDPDAYLKNQLTPVQQQMQETREMLWELQATQAHGAEAINAAKEAAQALMGRPEGRALHQQITANGNPYDNLVKWHKQQQVMQKIGNDPDAWLNAEIERRLSDPAEQAKIMERIRSGAASNTNRSQPVTTLPPSLSRMPAGGNQPADDDVSDGALFNFATR